MNHDEISPELLIEIDEKMQQLAVVAKDFHEAQDYVDRMVQGLTVDTDG